MKAVGTRLRSRFLLGNKTQTEKNAGGRQEGLCDGWEPCSQGPLALNPSTLTAESFVFRVSVFSSESGVVISALHTVKEEMIYVKGLAQTRSSTNKGHDEPAANKGKSCYCRGRMRLVPTQLLATSPTPPLDFPLLKEPLAVTGHPGKMSFQSYVSFIECWVEFPGEVYRLEIE